MSHQKPRPSAPAACSDGGRELAFAAFDTEVRLRVYPAPAHPGADVSPAALDAALAACQARCAYFEGILSRTRPDSDIARAHRAAPHPVPVAPETAEAVRLALGYCERSRGLFDITMGTVTSLWDFHAGRVPTALALSRALSHVDYRLIEVSPPGSAPTLAIRDPETILDLGGVAKGYIADDLAALLERAGVGRFALNLGGNVMLRGGRPSRADDTGAAPLPWRTGIADPFDTARFCAVVDVVDGSVVTSGARERSFIKGGRVYHHILDPASGMPAQSDVASATVVADRSLDCDGYSTTLFMLGAQEAVAFAEGICGIEALIVDDRGRLSWTSGLAGRVRAAAQPRR